MIIDFKIKESNNQAHIDIEKEMVKYKNNWFHFELRYSGGNIIDFVVRDYQTYEDFKFDKTTLTYTD
jgi:hypothetical protein